ncbi:hypothetical protein FB451DRAFT_1412210 [Mycena latifolia]|nr:hypothetical protein FB451DRAFT_1412210 [Mycena latifolia]
MPPGSPAPEDTPSRPVVPPRLLSLQADGMHDDQIWGIQAQIDVAHDQAARETLLQPEVVR